MDGEARNGLSRRRRRRRGDGVHRRAARAFGRDGHDRRSPPRPRRALDRRLSLRAAPSAVHLLRRQLGAARAGRPRCGRDERGLLRARRRGRDPGLLRARDASPLPAERPRPLFPERDYLGEHRFVSRLAEASWQVRVRRKLVDTTYLEGTIPATSPPPFEVADGVRCVPAGEIARLAQSARALRRSSARARPRSTPASGCSSKASRRRRSAGSGRARRGG